MVAYMTTGMQEMNIGAINDFVGNFWDKSITPTLVDYIKIPCLSIDFDPQWAQNGHMDAVEKMALQWLDEHAIADWGVHKKRLPGRTPLILIEIPGQSDDTLLLYGHLDKQPEMEGWWEGFGPWQPVFKDGKLYGRGGADDGYALFAAIAAVHAIQQQELPHARIVILIEFSEESGSPDLTAYLDLYKDIIGEPNLVVALDSGAGDYERLWSTTSLRGMLSCNVTVRVLKEAMHSGIGSGVIPSSMRIMRMLLDRLENAQTGEVLLPALHADIPEGRLAQAKTTAAILGDNLLDGFNRVPGLDAVDSDSTELLLNNTWRPTLCVVGQDGMPAVKDAGNVLRAYTRLKLAFRLPPTVDYRIAQKAIETTLLSGPPYGADVEVNFDQGGTGWDAPALAPWLEQANNEASRAFYGKDAAYFGLGASIPFMNMLGEQFPQAQFLITGVLGPKSNAHGPNEFIHLDYAKKLTACVAYIIARQYTQNS
jgi:acetylornithine deacetylase/succinyl-diaminopimelate desuccinylase-like protein